MTAPPTPEETKSASSQTKPAPSKAEEPAEKTEDEPEPNIPHFPPPPETGD